MPRESKLDPKQRSNNYRSRVFIGGVVTIRRNGIGWRLSKRQLQSLASSRSLPTNSNWKMRKTYITKRWFCCIAVGWLAVKKTEGFG